MYAEFSCFLTADFHAFCPAAFKLKHEMNVPIVYIFIARIDLYWLLVLFGRLQTEARGVCQFVVG